MLKLIALLVLTATTLALPTGIIDILQKWKQSKDVPVENKDTNEPPALFKDSLVDNFNSSDKQTYKQRYYVRGDFFNGTGPIFLYVGGEGGLSGRFADDSNMMEVGKQDGALLLGLEHRYYGESIPSNTTFKYLSSQQALADLAAFQKFISKEYNLTASNKWVSFGGSYPGMLSSFFRLKYPELVHAAVANSAPVQAIVDMQGYWEVIGNSFKATSAGGSAECYNLYVGGHRQIEKDLKTSEGRNELGKQFNICGGGASLESIKNQAYWGGNGVVPHPGQGDSPACTEPLCNYEKICDFLIAHKNESDIKAPLAAMSAQVNKGQCVNVTYEAILEEFNEEPRDFWTAWFYQTCNEFGFYQSCELNSTCPFLRGLDGFVNSSLEQCQTKHGFTPEQVYQNIVDTNNYYGGWKPNGTRIFYINGEVDPWHSLGVLPGHSPNPIEEPTHWVLGASHCAWMDAPQPTDTKWIQEAHAVIAFQVHNWLNEDDLFLQ